MWYFRTSTTLCYALTVCLLALEAAAGTVRVSKRQLAKRQQSDILQSLYDGDSVEVKSDYDFIIVGGKFRFWPPSNSSFGDSC